MPDSTRYLKESYIDVFLRAHPDYAVSDYQISCARYCEKIGKRFLVDFGFENAPDITWEHLEFLPYDYPMGHA